MLKGTSILLMLSVLIPLFPVHAEEASDLRIGFFRAGSKHARIYNASGEQQESITTFPNWGAGTGIPVELHASSEGTEWIYGHYERDLKIFNQSKTTTLFTFNTVAPTNYRPMVAVGELLLEYAGPEIATCARVNGRKEKAVHIYSYTETEGAVLRASGLPFEGSKRGCSGIAIGDLDGDSINEIAVFKRKRDEHSISVLTSAGEAKTTIALTVDSLGDHNLARSTMRILDVDGDDTDELVFAADSFAANMYNDFYAFDADGSVQNSLQVALYSSYGLVYGTQYGFGDMNGDGTVDLVLLDRNKKATVSIVGFDGELITTFQAFPNASYRVDRTLVVGYFQ